MSKQKTCKFEDSILAQIGFSKEEFEEAYIHYLREKMGRNQHLTPQEMKDYIDISENTNE